MTWSYGEGDWVAVPLADGRFAAGRLARLGKRSGIAFGYFFGIAFDAVPTEEQLEQLRPEDAVLACRFSDVGLADREWSAIRASGRWNRQDWPMPALRSGEPGSAEVVHFSDDDPNREVEVEQVDPASARELPSADLWGHRAVQQGLERRLG